jgi:hypothetical protein
MRSVSANLVQAMTTLVALTAFTAASKAADEIRIEGQYLQNRVCKGDRSDPVGLKVLITRSEIVYSGGTCSIGSRRDEEQKIIISVSCKFRSGAVMGADIAFSPTGGGALHMVQLDGSFESDLYKCPNG